ncbi:MAG: hypothetical protein P1U85_10350 [Verrucomicrobiales bacterium]|nr:hypothetical protein [Verrucomicrobiales bacterium]
MFSSLPLFSHAKKLLQDGQDTAVSWIEEKPPASILGSLAILFLGVGVYGASIGLWQGLEQACYVAIKLPFAILLTLLANGLLNGILASLLGVRLSFRETSLALLTSFAVFGLIVGSLSPITMGMAFDAPAPDSPDGPDTHRRLLLTHTLLIAFAGIISTGRLYQVLRHFADSDRAARHSLIGLLVGNLFAGAQISFLLRPIFGQPGLVIEFLRPDPFAGNFYESVWWAITQNL